LEKKFHTPNSPSNFPRPKSCLPPSVPLVALIHLRSSYWPLLSCEAVTRPFSRCDSLTPRQTCSRRYANIFPPSIFAFQKLTPHPLSLPMKTRVPIGSFYSHLFAPAPQIVFQYCGLFKKSLCFGGTMRTSTLNSAYDVNPFFFFPPVCLSLYLVIPLSYFFPPQLSTTYKPPSPSHSICHPLFFSPFLSATSFFPLYQNPGLWCPHPGTPTSMSCQRPRRSFRSHTRLRFFLPFPLIRILCVYNLIPLRILFLRCHQGLHTMVFQQDCERSFPPPYVSYCARNEGAQPHEEPFSTFPHG